jgi:hypothetical protein
MKEISIKDLSSSELSDIYDIVANDLIHLWKEFTVCVHLSNKLTFLKFDARKIVDNENMSHFQIKNLKRSGEQGE